MVNMAKKWIFDKGSDLLVFDPRQLLSRKKFFQSQGYETKIKQNYPRKGLMQLFYREKK